MNSIADGWVIIQTSSEFAPALASPSAPAAPAPGYAPPSGGLPWKAGRFSGSPT